MVRNSTDHETGAGDTTKVSKASYVVIIPAHNEEAFLGRTLESLVAQTQAPLRVVVVDDASTDGTEDVVQPFLKHDHIQFVKIHREPGRHFGNKVAAFNRGLESLAGLNYDFIGNLDADISFEPDYFARLLDRFAAQPELGIAGGQVHSWSGNRFVSQEVAPDSVAGAVQLFRRECFDAIGGYIALPLGGVDTAAEIRARAKGWQTACVPELQVKEHRATGWAAGSRYKARLKEGRRMHAMGYDLLFFCVRCVRRSLEAPPILGSLLAMFGFVGSALTRRPHTMPEDAIRYLRSEQRAKLRALFTGGKVHPSQLTSSSPSPQQAQAGSSSCAE